MRRLRPAYTDADLAEMYAQPHDHTTWHEHRHRVASTIAFGVMAAPEVLTIADLSCGDAAIPNGIADQIPVKLTLGDYAPGYEHTGPLEQTIHDIDRVDLFICSETLEHLDDPRLALDLIRDKANLLLLSTPLDEADDSNPEHYWSWSKDDIAGLLELSGWEPSGYYAELHYPNCHGFQIWLAK